MMTKKGAENAEKNICEKCDFICSKKSNYEKHKLTRKHQINAGASFLDDAKKCQKYVCDCGKEYSYRQGLYIHKKKCQLYLSVNDNNQEVLSTTNNMSLLTNLVMEVVKNISDLQKQSNDLLDNYNDNVNLINNNENDNDNENKNDIQKFINLFLEKLKNNNDLQQQFIEILNNIQSNTL